MPPEPSHAESPAAAGNAVPDGYVAVPISPDFVSSPLKIAAIVRQSRDPAAGRLVLLQDTVDARAYLGAIVDAGGQVQEWVELWVQSLDRIADTLASWREALSNTSLDERWRQWARFLCSPAARDRRLILRTGWETEHPTPVWLDAARGEPVPLMDPATGQPWRLCRDDAALAAAQLPAYTTSLQRYLYLPSQAEGGKFLPVTAGAPEGPRTAPIESALNAAAAGRDRGDLVPFNPGGGLLLVCRHGGLSLEAFLDLLGGAPADAPALAAAMVAAPALAALGKAAPGDGWLCVGPRRGARLLEALHLKLRVLADVVAIVRSLVEQTQRPMLNLEPQRFRVRLGEPGAALPVLWTAVTHLVEPGEAVEWPSAGSPEEAGAAKGAKAPKAFLSARPLAASVYRPVPARAPAQGQAAVRIDRILDEANGATVVEGSLQTQERFAGSAGDLVRVRASVDDGRIDFYAPFGAFKPQPSAAPPQWQFRTPARPLDPAVKARLQAAVGAALPNASFEVVPLSSTPTDLYALAVLAVRALLVDNRTTLPGALDELMGLARHVADEHDDTSPLRLRVRLAFESDPGWMKSLGPHRLTWDDLKPEQVFDLLPAELWWDVLAMLVRMLPGVGPDSTCKSFADAPEGALHRVFDDVAADLARLLMRARSLIVVDWRYNREMNAVIRAFLSAGTTAAAPGAAVPGAPAQAPPPLPGATGAPVAGRGRPTRAGDAKAR